MCEQKGVEPWGKTTTKKSAPLYEFMGDPDDFKPGSEDQLTLIAGGVEVLREVIQQPEVKIFVDPDIYPNDPDVYFLPKDKVLNPQNAGIDLRVCKLYRGPVINNAVVPSYPSGETYHLLPNTMYSFDTGVAMEIPPGYWGDVRLRSSMIQRGFIFSPPVIDSNYRGNIILAFYTSPITHPGGAIIIECFERFSQIVVSPYIKENISIVNTRGQLSPTDRGKKGFGEYTNEKI